MDKLIEIDELKKENKHLNLQLDQALKDYEELLVKIDKAIKYIKENDLYNDDYWEELGHSSANDEVARKDLLEILGDKV